MFVRSAAGFIGSTGAALGTLIVSALLNACDAPPADRASRSAGKPAQTRPAPLRTSALPTPGTIPPGSPPRALAADLPSEVIAFATRRDDCDHLRGEEGYDAARAAALTRDIARACTGTDRELASLRKRHAANPAAIAALAGYDSSIE